MFGLYYTLAKKERPSFLLFSALFPFDVLSFPNVNAFRSSRSIFLL